MIRPGIPSLLYPCSAGLGARTRLAAPRPARAFSLVELVLVLAILALLAGIAVPRYSQTLARQRVEAAARRIVTDLALAQRNARACGALRVVRFDTANHLYVLMTDTTKGLGPPCDQARWAQWADACTPNISRGEAPNCRVYLSHEPYESHLLTVNLGGDSEVIFDGFGTTDSGGSVTVGVGNYSKSITLSGLTGKAVAQ